MNILVQCIHTYGFYAFFSQCNYATFSCFDLNSINNKQMTYFKKKN